MIFKAIKIGLSISIEEKLINELVEIGKRYYPMEFGGFLIGNYSNDFSQLNITDTLLPNSYKATNYLFQRDTIGIYKKLREFYNKVPQKFYVGEWHTHPDNVPIPSNTDIIAISAIITHKEVSIQNPVLLIIGYSTAYFELGFYVSFNNQLYKYEKDTNS